MGSRKEELMMGRKKEETKKWLLGGDRNKEIEVRDEKEKIVGIEGERERQKNGTVRNERERRMAQ